MLLLPRNRKKSVVPRRCRTRMMEQVRLGKLFERFRYEQSVKNKKKWLLSTIELNSAR